MLILNAHQKVEIAHKKKTRINNFKEKSKKFTIYGALIRIFTGQENVTHLIPYHTSSKDLNFPADLTKINKAK